MYITLIMRVVMFTVRNGFEYQSTGAPDLDISIYFRDQDLAVPAAASKHVHLLCLAGVYVQSPPTYLNIVSKVESYCRSNPLTCQHLDVRKFYFTGKKFV